MRRDDDPDLIRVRLSHGYFDVDAAIVWATVRDDVQPLVTRLQAWQAGR